MTPARPGYLSGPVLLLRGMKRNSAVGLLTAVLLPVLAACTSKGAAAGHSSSAVSTPSSSTAVASDSSTSVAPALTPSSSEAARVDTTVATTHHTTAAPASSSPATVAGPAQMLSVTYSVSCTSHTDPSGTAKLSWTSKGSTSVYVLEGQVASALVGADAKSGGGKGPLAKSGSVTVPFACAQDYDYYLVEAYNSSDGTHSAIVEQVPFA